MKLAWVLTALLVSAPASSWAQRAAPGVTVLHDDARLRAQFEKDVAHVRLLLLLSPT